MIKKHKKRLLAFVLASILCLSFSITSFAASGYGYGYGYTKTFYVDLPQGGSKGRITIRIDSPDQNQAVWFKVTAPDNTVVWNHSNVGVFPNNGAEIKSPEYSNFQSGRYRVDYTCLSEIRFDCWIYNY